MANFFKPTSALLCLIQFLFVCICIGSDEDGWRISSIMDYGSDSDKAGCLDYEEILDEWYSEIIDIGSEALSAVDQFSDNLFVKMNLASWFGINFGPTDDEHENIVTDLKGRL